MKTKRQNLGLGLMVGILLGIGGCATQHTVRVDALAAGGGVNLAGVEYRLVSAMPGEEPEGLLYQEIAGHVVRALAERGLVLSGEGAGARMEVSVRGYLSEPMTESVTYSDAVYLDGGYRTQVVATPVVSADGKVVRYIYSQVSLPPRREFAGYVDREKQVTVYDKVLTLRGREVKADGSVGEELWVLTLAMRDRSSDLRRAVPILLQAGAEYIGRRSEGEQFIRVKPVESGEVTRG